jgi:methionyl aminopeptidase
MLITLKSPTLIKIMDEANKIVHLVLDHAETNVRAGMTTRELNTLLEQKLAEFPEATSAFKGYKGYPDVSCISVNEEVVHGIPGDRVIKEGDIVSVDFGVYYNKLAGDAARTFIIGKVNDDITKLVSETRRGLLEGIEQMREGNTLHDVSNAIDAVAKQNGYGNVKGFCGHGIGEKMHEPPNVFNYVAPGQENVRLRTGMVFALEPMFNLGTSDTIILEDKWTVITKDKSPSCHWELSVAITDDGPKILGARR